jgi:hypothetical protein
LMQIYAIMTRSMVLSLTLMHSLWLLTPPYVNYTEAGVACHNHNITNAVRKLESLTRKLMS